MIPISLFLYPPPPHHFFHSCIPFCSLFRTQSFFHLWSNLNISIPQNSFSIVFPISHVFSRPNSQDQTEIRCDYLIITMVDKPYCHHLARKCNARNIQSSPLLDNLRHHPGLSLLFTFWCRWCGRILYIYFYLYSLRFYFPTSSTQDKVSWRGHLT